METNNMATGLPVAFPVNELAEQLAGLVDANDSGKAVVGVGTVGVKSVWMWGRAVRCGVIFDLRVRAEARRLGLGAAITTALEGFAWSNGAAFTYLSVNSGNKRAEGLYEKLGYSLCSRRAIAFELVVKERSFSTMLLQAITAILSPDRSVRVDQDLDAARVPELPLGTRLRVRAVDDDEAASRLHASWGLEAATDAIPSVATLPEESKGDEQGGNEPSGSPRSAVWLADDAATQSHLVLQGGREGLGDSGVLVAPPATPASVLWLRNNARSAGYPPGLEEGDEGDTHAASGSSDLSRDASVRALAEVAAMSAAVDPAAVAGWAPSSRRRGATAFAAPDLAPLSAEAMIRSNVGLTTVVVEAVCPVAATQARSHGLEPIESADAVSRRRRQTSDAVSPATASPRGGSADGGAVLVLGSAQVSVAHGSYFGGMMLISGLWMPGHRLARGFVPWVAWSAMILAVTGSAAAVWGWTGGWGALTAPADWASAAKVWLAWAVWAGCSLGVAGIGAVLGVVLPVVAAPEKAFHCDGCSHGEAATKARLFAPAVAGAIGPRLLPLAVQEALKRAGDAGGTVCITNLAENHPFGSVLGAMKPRNRFLWKPRPVEALRAGSKVRDEPFEGTIRSHDCFDPRDL
jgi:GNAT superfamily N-acetyltransferase